MSLFSRQTLFLVFIQVLSQIYSDFILILSRSTQDTNLIRISIMTKLE